MTTLTYLFIRPHVDFLCQNKRYDIKIYIKREHEEIRLPNYHSVGLSHVGKCDKCLTVMNT